MPAAWLTQRPVLRTEPVMAPGPAAQAGVGLGGRSDRVGPGGHGVRQPGRGGPGENPRTGLVEPPAQQVLEVVMPAAFRRQIARAGGAAQAVGDAVILLAPPGRLPAGGEPARLVACLNERADRVRDPVAGARLLMGAAGRR